MTTLKLLAIALLALFPLALAGCDSERVRPNIELGIQISKTVCAAVLSSNPPEGDRLASACRVFMGVIDPPSGPG